VPTAIQSLSVHWPGGTTVGIVPPQSRAGGRRASGRRSDPVLAPFDLRDLGPDALFVVVRYRGARRGRRERAIRRGLRSLGWLAGLRPRRLLAFVGWHSGGDYTRLRISAIAVVTAAPASNQQPAA
jgi:hypothetical protein